MFFFTGEKRKGEENFSAFALNIKTSSLPYSLPQYTLSVSHLHSYVLLMPNALKCLGQINSIPFSYKYASPEIENSYLLLNF